MKVTVSTSVSGGNGTPDSGKKCHTASKLQNSVPKVDTQYVDPLVSEKPVSFTVNM